MQINTLLIYNDQRTVALVPNKTNFFDDLFADYSLEKTEDYTRIRLMLHVKRDITLRRAYIEIPFDFQAQNRIFCNGFQSWTESREFEQSENVTGMKQIARPLMQYFGDYHFPQIKYEAGIFHSWSYSYVRTGFQEMFFLGSLNEQTGYTIIRHDPKNKQIVLEKDCQDLHLAHSFPMFDIIIMHSSDVRTFDTYFKLMNCPPPKSLPAAGWTSWYQYYTKISQEIIFKNLAAFQEQQYPIQFFQIDDGYQTRVGDWLSIKTQFPNGMKPIAHAIHQAGYRAGLWLAPFICEAKSDIFKHKKHWLLKHPNGKPVRAGWNPLWSGWFYALDWYHQEVQAYLSGVFHNVLEKWGYDLVKLDFLYAAAILPREGKTRGQVMYEAMQFLRTLVGEKQILACGVPLGAAFGQVDYCRIGADIHLSWEHKLLKFLGNRERVSTLLALRSTLGRWQLNGRAFWNDPDVFILRKNKHQLSPTQQRTILIINALLGDLLFTSDVVSDYDAEAEALYAQLFDLQKSKVRYVHQQGDVYQIYYEFAENHYLATCNLSNKKQLISLSGNQASIAPFETLITPDAPQQFKLEHWGKEIV